eukprot:CAMPEP_0196658166 /NCGR_PEP_ID=MMETSP1086-20130531/27742_1 /TAXON_ID=77921 /ORGANISM="Cyanoptyche  gloeocystis , Strain SAG4.97" /LENGTH=128 /DNA_ID=CAMNT_0041991611 /DNA_START=414 /DNA_END=799 /DNA_ORIENTATION=-
MPLRMGPTPSRRCPCLWGGPCPCPYRRARDEAMTASTHRSAKHSTAAASKKAGLNAIPYGAPCTDRKRSPATCAPLKVFQDESGGACDVQNGSTTPPAGQNGPRTAEEEANGSGMEPPTFTIGNSGVW